MPELAADSIPNTLSNTGTATSQGPAGTILHIRELATKFSKKALITESDGGLLIKGVPMLASGTWTDSSVKTPLFYPEKTLQEYASNWVDTSGWSRHSGGVPRDITEKVAEARNLRYEDGAVTADVYVHPHTQKSRDTIELIKRKLISFVSVEHGGNEVWNPQTRQMEASTLTFSGFAFVNKGACAKCRINEQPQAAIEPAPGTEQEDLMDSKELSDAIAGAVAPLVKELEALKTVKPVEPVKVEIPKELSELVTKQGEQIKELSAQITELKKTPAEPKTASTTDTVKELGDVEFAAVWDKKTGTVKVD